MVRVKISVDPTTRKMTYELEGTHDEILQLSNNAFTKLNQKILDLGKSLEAIQVETKPTTAVAISVIQDFADLSGNRIQLGPAARKLSIRETLGLILLCSKILSRETVTSKDIHEILIENGIPYSLTSSLARLSEMTRDGLVMRVGTSTYKLSIFGESWIKTELEKIKGGETG